MNLEFFDKQGKLITQKQWSKLFQQGDYCKHVTQINGITIYTTWTGVDQPNPKGLWQTSSAHSKWDPNEIPQIIRTAVWDQDFELIESTQYPNEELALIGHEEASGRYKNLK
jgi:hypothetical protein